MEAKLFDGDRAEVSTFAFHEHRERAPHLEQAAHRPRLERAAQFVSVAADRLRGERGWTPDFLSHEVIAVSDLGCGDGGLLQLLATVRGVRAWGYDFAPANAAGWHERGVDGRAADVFGADRRHVILGDVVVMTEVLEHLTDPHGTLRWLTSHPVTTLGGAAYLVCSSPWTETAESHDGCHAWAWDPAGYDALLRGAGWEPVAFDLVGMFQIMLAKRVAP